MKSKLLLYLIIFFLAPGWGLHAINIAVVGCGFVGLTMAGLFTEQGHSVIGVDCNKEKIRQLQKGQLPIYEPHLKSWLINDNNSVKYTTDMSSAVCSADVIMITVSTPTNDDGTADLSCLYKAFDDIIALCDNVIKRVVCIKSTVPPGTVKSLYLQLAEQGKLNIHLVYNPEFMREGSAIDDICVNPVVLGGESSWALDFVAALYKNGVVMGPTITTTFETAELIKYAWNSFLAIRLTCVNELALLCKSYHADITMLIKAIGMIEEHRPLYDIKPGPGYGGSCFPKDTKALSYIMSQKGLPSTLVHQVIKSNDVLRNVWRDKLARVIDTVSIRHKSPVVAILGLSFKANTDDIRHSLAIDIIHDLSQKGVNIKAYDPQAMNNMAKLFPDICYCDSAYDAIVGSDCIVVLTEWEEFKNLDFERVASLSRTKILLDARNLFSLDMLRRYEYQL